MIVTKHKKTLKKKKTTVLCDKGKHISQIMEVDMTLKKKNSKSTLEQERSRTYVLCPWKHTAYAHDSPLSAP